MNPKTKNPIAIRRLERIEHDRGPQRSRTRPRKRGERKFRVQEIVKIKVTVEGVRPTPPESWDGFGWGKVRRIVGLKSENFIPPASRDRLSAWVSSFSRCLINSPILGSAVRRVADILGHPKMRPLLKRD